MSIVRTHKLSLRGATVALLLTGLASAHRREALPTSADDLNPPKIEVRQTSADTVKGLVFVAPKYTGETTTGTQGPEIIDDQGRVVWFHALQNGNRATDFHVQTYRGEPVITWSEGSGVRNADPNVPEQRTIDYIVDRSYRIVAKVQAGNGLNAEAHEFKITKNDTAIVTIYNRIPYDLSSVGGPADGALIDGVFQEIDVPTGRVLFEWHSLDHVALTESHSPIPTASGATFDYFHINAVSVDTDGNFLVSARNTWAVYKIHRRSGDVLFRLGGKKTDFTLGEGVEFAWQHDPEPVNATTFQLFDNEAGPQVRPASRVVWIARDEAAHTASLVRVIEHPDGLLAPSQGNSRTLPNGHVFVGWGQTGRFSEFNEEGDLLFDANVPTGYDTYRAYRSPWHARPDARPVATATRNADGTVTVHAAWNGATDIARWIVVGGAHSWELWPLGSAPWNGQDTAIALTTRATHVSVVALDARGLLVGKSEPVSVI